MTSYNESFPSEVITIHVTLIWFMLIWEKQLKYLQNRAEPRSSQKEQ